MTDAYATLREMLANVPDDAQVYVEELESIVEWPGITAGTFRQLLAEIAGFEWGWEQREKAHDAQLAEARQSIAEEEARADAIATHRDAYRAQLATAKREAFKSGMVYGINAGPDVTIGDMLDKVDAQYPATPSGEAKCADVAGCDGKCCATPSPEAREVPAFVLPVVQEVDAYVRITPEVAKRIVAMAQEAK
jgi:histidinol dehydrogenase